MDCIGPQGLPGADGLDGADGVAGTDGTDGINCWDLNANGTCDPATEDKNLDTVCDAFDCIGPKGDTGDTGADGADGVAGTDGTDGINCWDLNGDGVCDPATEDINSDTVCDALDCKGEDGTSLWTDGTSQVTTDVLVGIGTDTPTEMLTVAGLVESTTGGFKFPDGTVQTSAETSSSSGIGGIDIYTKLILHMNDDCLTDSSSLLNQITKYGNVAKTDIQSRFDGYSAYFGGEGDYLSALNNNNWDFGVNDFTIDLWARFDDLNGIGSGHGFIGQSIQGDNWWGFYFNSNKGLSFCSVDGDFDPDKILIEQGDITGWDINTWYHIAVVRYGNTITLYRNGIALASTFTSSPIHHFSTPLIVGYIRGSVVGTGAITKGHIDELRISKGIARWISSFTPPYASYDTGACLWAENSGNVYRETGSVGIGTDTPTTELEVAGTITATSFSGSMDWTNIINLPTGFSDNTDNVDDADANSANELNTSVNLNGTSLEITDAGGTLSADLSSLGGTDTDWTESGGNVYRESGNVGIGTTTPARPLHVVGTIRAYSDAAGGWEFEPHSIVEGLIIGAISGEANNAFFIDKNTGDIGIGMTSPGYQLDVDGDINISSGHNFLINGAPISSINSLWTDAGTFIQADNATEVVVTDEGKVGIGTTTPARPLHVVGTIRAYSDAAGGWEFEPHSIVEGLIIGAISGEANNAIFIDKNTGDIGIGMTSPGYQLDVDGDINISSGHNFLINGSPIETSSNSYWSESGNDIYYNTGNVGLGTDSPTEMLTVAGLVESTTGGFKFPDGTIQTSATTASGIGGNDSLTKLLLHMDDEGLTDSSISLHPVAKNGGVSRSSVNWKFGAYSVYFDGVDDYISIPDNEDWNFGSGDYTIDFWVYQPVSESIWVVNQMLTTGWYIIIHDDGEVHVSIQQNPIQPVRWHADLFSGPGAVLANEWHHIAYVRNNNYVYLFIDGILMDSATVSGTWPTAAGGYEQPLQFGREILDSVDYYRYYLDEFRISKGIARWTSNFIPPENPYHCIGSSLWTENGSDVFRALGYVGIGTDTPTTELEVDGTITATSFSGSMDWSNIINLPTGFNDNTDNVDDADANSANELNTSVNLNGTSLEITDAGGTLSADLSSLGGSDTDWTESGGNIYRETGNIGIGATTPTWKLDILTTVNADGARLVTNTDNIYLQLNNYGPNGNIWTLSSASGTSGYGAGNLAIIQGISGGLPRLVINNDGNVGIGTISPAHKLHVDGDIYATGTVYGASGTADTDWIESGGNIYRETGNVGIGETNPTSKLWVTQSGSTNDDGIGLWKGSGSSIRIFHDAGDNLIFNRGGDGGDAMAIDNSGNVGIGTTSPEGKLSVNGGNTLLGGNVIDPGVRLQVWQNDGTVLSLRRDTSDGDLIHFIQNGVLEGSISVYGNTVSYSQFTGSHVAHLINIENPRRGMVVILDHSQLGNQEDNQPQHYATITNKIEDKRVFGVIGSNDSLNKNDNVYDPNEYLIFSLGDGVILVTDTNGNIENGDFLTTSSRMGYAQKQTSGCMMNYTVAKSLADVNWDDVEVDPELGFKWKLIPVTYHAG